MPPPPAPRAIGLHHAAAGLCQGGGVARQPDHSLNCLQRVSPLHPASCVASQMMLHGTLTSLQGRQALYAGTSRTARALGEPGPAVLVPAPAL